MEVDRIGRLALAGCVALGPSVAVAAWLTWLSYQGATGDWRVGVFLGVLGTAFLTYLVVDRERRWMAFCGGVYLSAVVMCGGAAWIEAVRPAGEMGFWRFLKALGVLDFKGVLIVVGPAVGLVPACWLLLEFLGKLTSGRAEEKRKRSGSELYGKSRLLPRKYMKVLAKRQGILLGQWGNGESSPLIGWNLEGSAISLAPPRTGKGATIALNYLAPKGRGWVGSTVLVDPRGETWCVVSQRRMDMGRKVILLDPFGVVENHKKETEGLVLPVSESRCYNPMDFIRKDNAQAPRDINVLLDALLTPPQGGGDSSSHFYESARAIIGGYMAWVAFTAIDAERNLQEVYRLLTLPPDERKVLMESIRTGRVFAGGLAQIAAERQLQVGQQEAGSNFSTIANQLAFLNYPQLAENTRKSDFDPMDLADGAMDLFVVVPEEMTEHAKAWLRLWVTIPNAVSGQKPLKQDMLIVIDEMPKLGLLKPVMDGYTMSAGRGVHYWCFAHSVSALDSTWGAENRQILVELAEVVQILGFPRTDVNGAEALSAAIGSASFENRSESHSGKTEGDRMFAGGTELQVSDSLGVVKERLVTTDDILTMGPDLQYIVGASKDLPRDAFTLRHARYWERPDSQGLAKPNPFVLRKQRAAKRGVNGMFVDKPVPSEGQG